MILSNMHQQFSLLVGFMMVSHQQLLKRQFNYVRVSLRFKLNIKEQRYLIVNISFKHF